MLKRLFHWECDLTSQPGATLQTTCLHWCLKGTQWRFRRIALCCAGFIAGAQSCIASRADTGLQCWSLASLSAIVVLEQFQHCVPQGTKDWKQSWTNCTTRHNNVLSCDAAATSQLLPFTFCVSTVSKYLNPLRCGSQPLLQSQLLRRQYPDHSVHLSLSPHTVSQPHISLSGATVGQWNASCSPFMLQEKLSFMVECGGCVEESHSPRKEAAL